MENRVFKVGDKVYIKPECNHVWAGIVTVVQVFNSNQQINVKHHKHGVGGFGFNEVRHLTPLEKLL